MTAAAPGSTHVPTDAPDLAGQVRRGLAWSTVSSLVLRSGNLLVGVALARLLAPDDFGVFAVALTVQSVLLTLADLGMGADLVRSERPEERAPTVATLALLTGGVLTLAMVLTAGPLAVALGSADAAPVIAVLSLTLVLSSLAVVPGAFLAREFQQKRLFVGEGTNFAVSTTVAVLMVVAGAGPMALAVSRLAGQSVGTVLQFVLARRRPRWGFDRSVAGSALRFGLPLAAANMLSWALLSVDNVVISHASGVVALGFYVLAFNVSSWPMTAIGQAVRPVTLAAFSRLQHSDPGPPLARATALTAAAAAPAGVLLAVLAGPVVALLYGERWAPSADALAGLALFGGVRIVLDMLATYLIARGAVAAVLWTQVVWLVTLVPAMVLGIRWGGLAGAGWAHVAVGVFLVLPVYLVAVRRTGAPVKAVAGNLWQPVLAVVPAALVGQQVAAQLDTPVLALLAGGASGLAAYALLIGHWVRSRVAADEVPAPPETLPVPAGAGVVAVGER